MSVKMNENIKNVAQFVAERLYLLICHGTKSSPLTNLVVTVFAKRSLEFAFMIVSKLR